MPEYIITAGGHKYKISSRGNLSEADIAEAAEYFISSEGKKKTQGVASPTAPASSERTNLSGRGITIPSQAQNRRIGTPSAGKTANSNGTPITGYSSIGNSGQKKAQPKSGSPASLQREVAAEIEANQLANRLQRSQYNPDPMSALSFVTQPISHLLSMGARFLGQHTPSVTGMGYGAPSFGGSTPPQPPGAHQKEFDRQTARMDRGSRMDAEDPRGFGFAVNPDLSRQMDKPGSNRGTEGAAKGATKFVMGLSTLDNAVLAAAMGSPAMAGGAGTILQRMAAGVFGKDMALAAKAGLDKFRKSGYKDTEALTEAALNGVVALGALAHGTKGLKGKLSEALKKKPAATAPKEAPAPTVTPEEIAPKRPTRKPNPKPPADTAAHKAKALEQRKALAGQAEKARATMPPKAPEAPSVAPAKPKRATKAKAEVPKAQSGTYYHVSEVPQAEGLKAQPFGVEKDPVVWLSRGGPVVRDGHVYSVDASKVPGLIRDSRNGFPVHLGDIPKEALTYLGERSAHEPFKLPAENPKAEAPPRFTDWVETQPKGKVYTKASDLYQAYKMEHPKTTREEFGQMFQQAAAHEGYEVVTPSANTPESGVFQFKDSTGKMVRVSGVRPRSVSPTDGKSTPEPKTKAEVEHPLAQKAIDKLGTASEPGKVAWITQSGKGIAKGKLGEHYDDAGQVLGVDTGSDASAINNRRKAVKELMQKSGMVRYAASPNGTSTGVEFHKPLTENQISAIVSLHKKGTVFAAEGVNGELSGFQSVQNATGLDVRRALEKVNSAISRPTDKAGEIKLSQSEANTLGFHHAEGDALGDRLTAAKKGVPITAEQQIALQKLVKEKGLARSQFPNLYKESAKDIAISEKGPQELHAGVNPFDLLRAAKNSHLGQAVGDAIYGQKSSLTHESRTSLESVNKHENARMTAGLHADDLLPPVTARLSPEDTSKFGAYGLADRMRKAKKEAAQVISDAPARRKVLLKAVRSAEAARDAAILSHDPGAISKAQRALREAQAVSTGHLKAVAEAKKEYRENALERVGHPFSVTLPDGTIHVIKEADITPFLSRPEIAAAMKLHKSNGEAFLHDTQTRQGNQAGVSPGEHSGSYFPARALNADGTARVGAGSKGGAHQAKATLAKNVSAERAQFNAHSYETDYHTFMRDAMSDSLSRATEREMHNTLLANGQEVPFDTKRPDLRYKDGQLEIEYKGQWEPGKDFSIQKGESRDERLPERVVMPLRLYNEMEPLFDPQRRTLADQMANNVISKVMRTYLMAPADAMQHTAALSARSAYGAARAVSPTDTPIVTGIKQVGRGMVAPFQSAVNFVRFWNPNLYDQSLRARAMKSMSEAGVLPSNFGDTGKTPETPAPKNMLDRRNWTKERAKHAGHNILYGDRGVLSNAGTAVYKIFEDQGALKTEEGRSMLHQALRETFNTYSKTDKPLFQKGLQSVGFGSFYETGLKNRTAALSAGKHVYLASLASRAIVVIGAVKAATGKYPWEIPGYKWGYVPLYKDPKTGEVLMFDAKVFDRVGFYPDQILHSMAQNAYDVKTKKISARAGVLEASTGMANWAAAPAVSGPAPQVLSNITGKLPYAYPDRTLSGIEFADNPSKKQGVTPMRGLSLLESALPLSGVLLFDPAHEARATTPKSESAGKINRVLRWAGLPQLQLPVDEKVVEKRRLAAEKGAARADAKAMGHPLSSGRRSRALIPNPLGGRRSLTPRPF